MNRTLKLALAFASSTAIVIGLAAPASAHEANTTAVEFSLTDTGIDGEIDLPIDELGDALDVDIATDAFGLSLQRDLIVEYVVDEFEVSGSDAALWPLQIGQIRIITSDDREYVRVATTAENVTDADGGEVTITSEAIIEHDESHKIVVTVIDADGSASIAGYIDSGDATLDIRIGEDGSLAESSFTATLEYGFEHVLDGADHLLFLLTLLLPAPMIVAGHRWRSAPGFWHGFKRVLHVATAFMLGHSISLAASAFGLVSLPSRPVEILIAVSVAVSAIHAIRPITRHGEIPIAAGFGLIHGLAFAEILEGFGLDDGNTITTLFAFNLGVELAQLATIAVAFPALWLLSRTRAYDAVRVGGAGFSLVLALAWTADRLGVLSNPLSSVEDALVDNLGVLAIALAVTAGIVWFGLRRSTPSVSNNTASTPAGTVSESSMHSAVAQTSASSRVSVHATAEPSNSIGEPVRPSSR